MPSRCYTDVRISPMLPAWSELLNSDALDQARLSELRRTARKRLVDSAEQFVLRLNTIADEAGLPPNHRPLLTGDPGTQPIVMTGHQPVLFHSGLTYKYEITESFAAEHNAIAVAVIIDTDRGDAGQFSFPEASQRTEAQGVPRTDRGLLPLKAQLAIDSTAQSNNLFGHGRLKTSDDLRALSERVTQSLTQLGKPAAANHTADVFSAFAQLSAAKASAMEANTVMRWLYGTGSQMLELPLSAIASFPESLMLTVDILKQPRRFAAAYNSALASFREENGIRNTANPFPGLKTDSHGCELPFWVIDHNRGTRQVLEVQVDGNVTRLLANGRTVDTFTDSIADDSLEPMMLQNLQIVPRGALITAFLRLLFSDLFVHGTGGGRYDRFTDEFIRSWWNTEPPAFTVASASRYLFYEQRCEVQRLESIRSQLRELQYNPQRHFGQGLFSDELEEQLAELVQQKDTAVSRMKQAHASGDSARELGRDIQRQTNQIRDLVMSEFESQVNVLNAISPEQHDAINCRTYPWFFFPPADSRP
ncbi:MAG: hypothetical protein R3C49_10010 [Planctomycetaceae bacterium]